MTYLQLVNLLKLELGVEGDDVATVTGQTAMNKKLVEWIKNADTYIQSLHWDWKFLWTEWSQALVVGSDTPTIPADVHIWDRDSFWLDYTTDDNRQLSYLDYYDYRDTMRAGVKSNQKPSQVVIRPDNALRTVYPSDGTYTLYGEYWKNPVAMSGDTDESDIPVAMQRIIVVQAKLWYAEEEEFPLLIETANSELRILLQQLESSQLPDNENRNMASGPAMTMYTE